MDGTAAPDRRLTHVELVYRPGERHLARKLFSLLGCEPVDRGGPFLTAFVEPSAGRDYANNVLYASEVRPAQWRFEQALAGEVAGARDAYTSAVRRQPQHAAHFGFRVPDEAALEDLVARVRRAGDRDPDLAGRVAVDGVYRPGEPGAIAQNMVQAFVWTDVVAAGLLCLGQHVEVQWHLPTASCSVVAPPGVC